MTFLIVMLGWAVLMSCMVAAVVCHGKSRAKAAKAAKAAAEAKPQPAVGPTLAAYGQASQDQNAYQMGAAVYRSHGPMSPASALRPATVSVAELNDAERKILADMMRKNRKLARALHTRQFRVLRVQDSAGRLHLQIMSKDSEEPVAKQVISTFVAG